MKKLFALLIIMITAAPAWTQAPPPVSIVLGPRHGHATPQKSGCARLAGGNIFVAQPSPDVVIITMSGAAVATASPLHNSVAGMHFDLNQDFKILFADPKVKGAKLYVEGRVIGLLRSGTNHYLCKKCPASAQQGTACAAISCGDAPLVSVCVDPHPVSCGEYLSINCQQGPLCAPVVPGCFTLHQTFDIQASYNQSFPYCQPATAEFAPDAVDPLWLSYKDPFRGVSKRDFGFQVTLRVVPY